MYEMQKRYNLIKIIPFLYRIFNFLFNGISNIDILVKSVLNIYIIRLI